MTKKIIIVAGALVAILSGGAGNYFLKPDLVPDFIRPKDGTQDKMNRSP